MQQHWGQVHRRMILEGQSGRSADLPHGLVSQVGLPWKSCKKGIAVVVESSVVSIRLGGLLLSVLGGRSSMHNKVETEGELGVFARPLPGLGMCAAPAAKQR